MENNINRIFTGEDKPINAEQFSNIIHSTEYDEYQRKRIKEDVKNYVPKTDTGNNESLRLSISLITRKNKKAEQMFKDVLNARLDGYSIRQIARAMKVDRSLVEKVEKEAIYEVQVALSKRKILPVVGS